MTKVIRALRDGSYSLEESNQTKQILTVEEVVSLLTQSSGFKIRGNDYDRFAGDEIHGTTPDGDEVFISGDSVPFLLRDILNRQSNLVSQ